MNGKAATAIQRHGQRQMNMDDFDNPYRAPASDALAADSADEVTDGITAYRYQQLMIVPREGASVPRACAVSNRTEWLTNHSVAAVTRRGMTMTYLVFQLPAVGWLIGSILHVITRSAQFTVFVRTPIMNMVVVAALVMLLLLVGGNTYTAVGLWKGNYQYVVVGLAMSAAAVLLDWLSDWFIPYAEPLGEDFIAVRGVHPDYLDRLPEFPDPTREDLNSLV